MIKNISQYVSIKPAIIKTLQILKEKGKMIFFLTNSSVEYTELVMKQALGQNWKNYFDFQVANCFKPLFHVHDCPFYCLDDNKPKLCGVKVENEV